MAAYYQPAREVGGDFYDFLDLEDGRLGLVVGDVTDKGVPAALVMATTRTMLRAAAQRLFSPGEVLQAGQRRPRYQDIPPNMFVTCLYAILDPESGRLVYANAGHDLPYRRRAGRSEGAEELRATGMPLGLMPGMGYEEKEIVLERGESVLFYSDGLVEAHDPRREMFGFPRLQGLVGAHRSGGSALVSFLLSELSALHRRGLGAGGRHHAGHPGEIGGAVTAPRNERQTDARRAERAERARQRAPGDGGGRRRPWRGSGCRTEPSSGSRPPWPRRR